MNAWGYATIVVGLAIIVLMIYDDLQEAKRECEEVKSSYPYWLSAAFWITLFSL